METDATRIGRDQVRRIQALRHARKVDDDTWAAMKASVGVASTLDLTPAMYRTLMDRLMGGSRKEPKQTRRSPLGRWVDLDAVREERRPLLRKLMALLLDGGKTWAYADGIARRMHGIERVEWCDPHQLHGIVQALAIHKGRHAGSGGA